VIETPRWLPVRKGTTTEDPYLGPSRGIDATTVLTVYVCLLLAIPSAMTVAPLGSAGAPSAIMAVGAFFWWAWFHIHRSREVSWGFQPVRASILVWLLLMLIVYAHAMSSPIPSDEISPADNGMLKLVGFSGILLVANDGISTMERARTILRRLVIGAGLIAVLGVIQYATKQLWIDRIHVPGLTAGTVEALATRSGLARPSGTSTHPIEYGVVLTMILPLAITYALKSPTHRWIYKGFLCALAFVVFLSISRSTLVCAAVGLIVLAMSWTLAARVRALVFVLATTMAVYVTVPGTLGTLTRLFTGASNDSSIASRTGSYDIAAQFISRSPLLGRGFGTFLPKYWILDNGYLGLLIEGGIVGFGGLLMVIVAGALAARRARQLGADDFDRSLGQALLASIVAGACGLAFFDTFGFPQSAGCFFLLLGLAGAARRLTQAQPEIPQLASLSPSAFAAER
jgi:polysaccharide biosynthesis protein PslJ